jgi:hypothetical protein
MSSRGSVRRRRSRIGIYDNQLVCAACERRFDQFDNYAAKLLIEGVATFGTVNHDGRPIAYQVNSFDYPKLKMFCLSLLWRAAVSNRPEFASVALGPFLPGLTAMVIKGDPDTADKFATILCRFSEIESWQSGFISPVRRRYEEVNFYKFVMGAYVLHIKVDQKLPRDPLNALIIRPDAPLTILAQEFRDSPEFRTMLKLVKLNARNHRKDRPNSSAPPTAPRP